MSREGLAQLIMRALEDEGFRDQIKANPDAALAQFDLSAEEVAAIKSGDTSRLQDMGIDERVSKIASYAPQSFVPTVAPSGSSPESILGWLVTLFSKTSTTMS